ncbi:FHA domain-containing protein [Streptomyces aurantiogriseus]|uniref:FHA domain-containing protein n=1 Tax=Streptomyces aurantiogriseus TaxID=66870 RepID=UPI00167824EA|nr:FHA domain-containing protein [Streptomyces aurantiogriseus]
MPGPRHVDRGLADDDALLGDEDEEEYAPTPQDWPEEVLRPRTQVPPGPARPCWRCAFPVPSGTSVCPECLESARHLRLVGTRPQLDIRHGEGPPLRLGRHPVWARPEVATALRCEEDVSRCHATIRLAPDGTLWLTENPAGTSNGTYVNNERIPQGTRVPLHDGDVIGLGRRVALTVLLTDP